MASILSDFLNKDSILISISKWGFNPQNVPLISPQNGIAAKCYFLKMLFSQNAIFSKCYLLKMLSPQNAIPSECYLLRMLFPQNPQFNLLHIQASLDLSSLMKVILRKASACSWWRLITLFCRCEVFANVQWMTL